MAKTASKSISLSNFSQKSQFFAVLMYSLHGHPRYFKSKRKYQQYGPWFKTIFPFLMTMIKVITYPLEKWHKFETKFTLRNILLTFQSVEVRCYLAYLLNINTGIKIDYRWNHKKLKHFFKVLLKMILEFLLKSNDILAVWIDSRNISRF